MTENTLFLAKARVAVLCLLFITVTFLVAASARPDTPKPLGCWFSGYEKYTVDDEFIWQTGLYFDTQFGEFNPAQLPKYSAVLLGNRTGRALTPAEITVLEKWVAAGGTFIFTADELRRLCENKPPAWLAGEGAGNGWVGQPFVATILKPDHPLARGLDKFVQPPRAGIDEPAGWLVDSYLGIPGGGGTSIIGKDDRTLLFVKPHGKGQVIYVGADYIPTAWPKLQDGQVTMNLQPQHKQFLLNLAEYLKLPTRTKIVEDWSTKYLGNDKLVVWNRHEGEKPLGGAYFSPPYPANAGELLPVLHYDMGIGERNRRYFIVTTRSEIPQLIVQPTDLIGPGGKKLAASHVQIFVQDKPVPDYPKAPYYLVNPMLVDPIGSPGVKVPRYGVKTYWVRLDTDGAVPGDYRGSLKFSDGKTLLKTLPIEIKVWPLHQPGCELLNFEYEHTWLSLPGGWWLDPKNDGTELKKYIDRLGSHEVNVGETWGDMGYYLKFVYLRDSGTQVEEAMRKDPQRFSKDPMPSLAFAGPWDGWWNNAIAAGMDSFSQTWALDTDIGIALAREMSGDDKLAAGSPEHLRFSKWFNGEFHKYLRERGLRDTYIKIGDEFGPEGADWFIQSAAVMQSAGFKTYTTAYNLVQDKNTVEKMDPYMDMWQLSFPEQYLRVLLKQNNIPFDDKNVVWGVRASSYWGPAIQGPRGVGMLAARQRVDGLHVHGYMRWHQNEAESAYVLPNQQGPADTPAAVNWGQTVTEGRYLAQLYHMIDGAKRTGKGAAVAAQIEKEIDRDVIGPAVDKGPGPLIPLVRNEAIFAGVKSAYMEQSSAISYETAQVAKVKVFEMLLRLQKAMNNPAPDLEFDGMTLVRSGKCVARIIAAGSATAANKLSAHAEELVGVKVPVSAEASLKPQSGIETVVLIGTLKDNAALADLVSKELPTEITPLYPSEGRYVIRRLSSSANHPAVIVVAGGDTAGAAIGAANLGHLLTPENQF